MGDKDDEDERSMWKIEVDMRNRSERLRDGGVWERWCLVMQERDGGVWELREMMVSLSGEWWEREWDVDRVRLWERKVIGERNFIIIFKWENILIYWNIWFAFLIYLNLMVRPLFLTAG